MNDVANYRRLSKREHVNLLPAMYMGSVSRTTRDDFFFDSEKGMVWTEDVPFVEGLVKILNEAIDNATDNALVSNNPTRTIKVTLTDSTFRVSNDGQHIPVDVMVGGTERIPEVIFGDCLSGSKFNDDRVSIGTHGVGIKLANIMSDEFTVTCHDPVNRLTYRGRWIDGMGSVVESSVCPLKKNPPFSTEVLFRPTLSRFGCADSSLSDMAPWVFTRLTQLASIHPDPALKIYFNGTMLKRRNFKAYIKQFRGCVHSFYSKPNENFEYAFTLSQTGVFQHQTFVNCHRTTLDSSTETRYVCGRLVSIIRKYLATKHKGSSVSAAAISSRLHIFVKLRMVNPAFSPQTKTELTTPITPSLYPIDEAHVLGALKKSSLLDELEKLLHSKSLKQMTRVLNGTKQSHVAVEKYDGAHGAGTKDSGKCTLFIVEGDSAKTLVTTGMSEIGRKYYGVFPIRGKLLNVRGASSAVLKGNKEVLHIMKILGLKFGCTYDTAVERATLRYGKLCILTDADDDGHHITGLLLNFIDFFWPLLTRHFMVRFVTPIIKATRGTVSRHFFNTVAFDKWFAETPDASKYFVLHLKGLGSSTKADAKLYFRNMSAHLKTFRFNPDTTSTLIDNIFNAKKTHWRKQWLTGRGENSDTLDYASPLVPVDDFMNIELYQFFLSDIVRSIPSVVDGLKKSQRQALCGALFHFDKNNNRLHKVAQLAGLVAAHVKYAHGEVSMQDTIIGLAQDFPGSNNMPFFTTEGAFGSRMMNGKDAASPRYISTSLRPETRKLFLKGDDDILDYDTVEGTKVQSRFYVPTLPALLLNGSVGIGTGFATKLPCFSVPDVIAAVRLRLHGEPHKLLLPHYAEPYSTNHLTTEETTRWVFRGAFKQLSPLSITITELPIGVSMERYKDNVLDTLLDKKVISKYLVDHVDENIPRFHLTLTHPLSGTDADLETLKLTSTITKKCMYFLDSTGRVKHYQTTDDIVDDWLATKLLYTEKRRLAIIGQLSSEIELVVMKKRFIRAVVDATIVIAKRTRVDVESQMTALKIPSNLHGPFMAMSIMSITEERIDELDALHDALISKLTSTRELTAETMYLEDLEVFCKRNTKRQRESAVEAGIKKIKV
jgi:DNA topoisomerase-2